MELRARASLLAQNKPSARRHIRTLRASMHAKRLMTEPQRRFQTNCSRGNYHVGKQQSIQWIRGAGHREGEKVLQRNAGVKDIREPGLLRLHLSGGNNVLVYPQPNHVPATL